MPYPSDLKEKEWLLIKQYFEQKNIIGRPLKHNRRDIINAIFYITKSGCHWRMMPQYYPPWQPIYDYFKKWCVSGTWEAVLDILDKKDRLRQGRQATPSYGILLLI